MSPAPPTRALEAGPLDSILEQSAEPPESLVVCRRCRKTHAVGLPVCPQCGLWPDKAKSSAASRPVIGLWRPLLVSYSVILCVTIGTAAAAKVFAARILGSESTVLLVITAASLANSLVILAGWWQMRSAPDCARHVRRPIVAWMAAVPATASLIALNWALRTALRAYGIRVFDLAPSDPALWPWTIAVICVMPAVFEELYFRGAVQRVIGGTVSWHSAVWVSAAMFGMAHIGDPLSIPFLIFAGVVLGYARAFSGSLLLPMLMHALHNLGVLLWTTS